MSMHRREFLRKSAATGAGLLVLTHPLRRGEAAEPLPTRVWAARRRR